MKKIKRKQNLIKRSKSIDTRKKRIIKIHSMNYNNGSLEIWFKYYGRMYRYIIQNIPGKYGVITKAEWLVNLENKHFSKKAAMKVITKLQSLYSSSYFRHLF